MAIPTRPTGANSPIVDCLRKTQFATKRQAKEAAKRRSGPTVAYECPHPNHDGFVTASGRHWHYARRTRQPRPSDSGSC